MESNLILTSKLKITQTITSMFSPRDKKILWENIKWILAFMTLSILSVGAAIFIWFDEKHIPSVLLFGLLGLGCAGFIFTKLFPDLIGDWKNGGVLKRVTIPNEKFFKYLSEYTQSEIKYNKDVAIRFTKDSGAAIPIPEYKEHFLWSLAQNQEYLKSWKELWDFINFLGTPEKFLDFFYKTRNDILQDILKSESYKNFLTLDMKKYEIPKDRYNAPRKGFFVESNIGKKIIHIDLKKANFQALKEGGVIDPGYETYEDFLSPYIGDFEYFRDSKYIRQVIFGKLNVSRQTTIERWILDQVRESLGIDPSEVLYFGNDDFAILDDGRDLEYTGPYDVKIERYTLQGYRVKIGLKEFVFYETLPGQYKSIPMPYVRLVNCLLSGNEPNIMDRYIITDGTLCIITDQDLELTKL